VEHRKRFASSEDIVRKIQTCADNRPAAAKPNLKKWPTALCLLAVCLLAGSVTSFAQLQAGRIVGQVFDPQHASVAGATITVTDPATNISETVKTDASGNYVVTPLDPGTYSVSATAQGFQTEVRNGIELTVG
jgi:cytochrome c-type biogenesis protein CcmH/NrfG